MKLTEKEAKILIGEIHYWWGHPKFDEFIINHVESILSRPEQGGEEEIAEAAKMVEKCFNALRLEVDGSIVNDIKLRCNNYSSLLQLRTAQLRSELAEAKREVEGLKISNNALQTYIRETESEI